MSLKRATTQLLRRQSTIPLRRTTTNVNVIDRNPSNPRINMAPLRRKKNAGKVTKKNLMKMVQKHEKALGERELKYVGLQIGYDTFLSTATLPSVMGRVANGLLSIGPRICNAVVDTGSAYNQVYPCQGSIFICTPAAQAVGENWNNQNISFAYMPRIFQGNGNKDRIGDKLYFTTMRLRLIISLDPTFFTGRVNLVGNFLNTPGANTPAVIASEGWVASATIGGAGVQYQKNIPIQPVAVTAPYIAHGIKLPFRVIHLAVREDYIGQYLATNTFWLGGTAKAIDPSYLPLEAIFTDLNDYEGDEPHNVANMSHGTSYFFSRKVRNLAAGKVRIIHDDIHWLTSTDSMNTSFLLDKSYSIRQQYDFQTGKTQQWIHGVMIAVPSEGDVFRAQYFGDIPKIVQVKTSNINNENTNVDNNVWYRGLQVRGSAAFYYYDT